MDLKLDFTFDDKTYRHYINGVPFVLHCHHYMTLTTKLAEDFAHIGGPRILAECAEDSVRPVFDDYAAKNGLAAPEQRLAMAAAYYSAMGLGKMTASGTADGGEVRLDHCHMDEGWIKKWGKREQPVNFFTCGYVAAMFASAFGKPARSYRAVETASLVKGDPQSVLTVTLGK